MDAYCKPVRLRTCSHGLNIRKWPPPSVWRPSSPDVSAGAKPELSLIEAGSANLVAADPGGGAVDFYVSIRGEDVTLEKTRAEQSSARNHLRGHITDIIPAGVLTKVIVDVGFELTALVTRQAIADLGLEKGSEVFGVFKASAVHLIPRSS